MRSLGQHKGFLVTVRWVAIKHRLAGSPTANNFKEVDEVKRVSAELADVKTLFQST